MSKRKVQGCFLFLLLVSMILGLAAARGDVLFSESFDYPVGSLAGNGPPPGSPPGQGPWIALDLDPHVSSPGLQFPKIAAVGNAVTLGDDPEFNGGSVAADIAPVGEGIVWIGFLMQQNQTDHPIFGFNVLTFNDGFGATAPQFGVIFNTNRYGIDDSVSPTKQTLSDFPVPQSTAVWLVVKLDFDTGKEFLFVNPSRSGSEPSTVQASAHLRMTREFQEAGVSRIVLKNGFCLGTYTFDEIRVGTSFADLRP